MKTFANLQVATRLAIGMTAILLLSLTATATAIWHLSMVAEETRTMMREPLAKERYVADWYRVIHTAVRRTAAITKSNDATLGDFFAEDAGPCRFGVADRPCSRRILIQASPT